MEIKQHLDPMVLFVQKVNLVLQLLQVSLIDFLLVLLRQLVHVLTTLVKLAQSQNFVISGLDCSLLRLQLLLEL